MRWSETDLAYAAGYLDGEGCFTIGSNWRIQVCCTNTCREAIQWLYDTFGGNMSGPKEGRKANWRPTYFWRASNLVAKELLPALMPYLREKKPQAELLLKMHDTMTTTGRRLPPEVLAERNRIKQEVKELKRAA
jgi:hypothetical protein